MSVNFKFLICKIGMRLQKGTVIYLITHSRGGIWTRVCVMPMPGLWRDFRCSTLLGSSSFSQGSRDSPLWHHRGIRDISCSEAHGERLCEGWPLKSHQAFSSGFSGSPFCSLLGTVYPVSAPRQPSPLQVSCSGDEDWWGRRHHFC